MLVREGLWNTKCISPMWNHNVQQHKHCETSNTDRGRLKREPTTNLKSHLNEHWFSWITTGFDSTRNNFLLDPKHLRGRLVCTLLGNVLKYHALFWIQPHNAGKKFIKWRKSPPPPARKIACRVLCASRISTSGEVHQWNNGGYLLYIDTFYLGKIFAHNSTWHNLQKEDSTLCATWAQQWFPGEIIHIHKALKFR